jgi:hypothetical protein
MARSRFTEDQALDVDFFSEEEATTLSGVLQAEIDAKPDNFLDLGDTPDGYTDDYYLRFTASGIEASVVQATAEFPRYYIESDIIVLVNDFGQYAIRETGYIEVAGTLEFGNGGMLIIV